MTFAIERSWSKSNPGRSLRSPLLWYMGSARGPARSKTMAAGKPCSTNDCGGVLRLLMGEMGSVWIYVTYLVITAACLIHSNGVNQ